MMIFMMFLSFMFLYLWAFNLKSYFLKTFVHNIYFLSSFFMLFFFFFNNKLWLKINYIFGISFYSFSLLLLSFWIFGLMIMSIDYKIYKFKFCLILMNLLLFLLVLSFSVMNLFFFYFLFEFSLIPTILLIMIWGMSMDRVSAFFYLLFYTLMFSLTFLILVIYLKNIIGSTMIFLLEMYDIKVNNLLIYFLMISSFLVKMPMFMLHNWLLKAHVESPVYGSMFLAGLMLKLGSYGFLRVILLMIESTLKYSYIFISINLVGMIFISLICLCQIDMKIIVAYSSVVHMSMLISGIFTLFKIGIMGAYMMMIAHGLCSSGLFYLVNICYERTGSRLILLNKGMSTLMPSMTLFWFLLCSSNMSAPLSLNLISEIFLISSILIWSKYLVLFMILINLFSFTYSLYLYSYVQHGNIYSKKMFLFNSGKLIEYLILILHWLPLNLFILNLNMYMF